MEYLKTLVKNRKLILQLGKNDFKNRFAGTALGVVWGFISPFVFMATYVIVFQFILKTKSAGDLPFVVWYIPGIAMWMFINDSINSATNSIRSYSYLVKKIVFPVDIIPIISLVSTSIISFFLFAISIIVCSIFGYFPNILLFIYYIVAGYALILAITRLTSAVATLVPDFGQLLNVFMQLFMWLTPIMWNISMLESHNVLYHIVKALPFSYLVNGFREVFSGGNLIYADHGIYTIIFWVIVVLLFMWGNAVFKRSKKDFADVL